MRVQNPIHLDDQSEPEPEIALLRQRGRYYRTHAPTPDGVLLLIEVSNTSLEEDRVRKVGLYAQAGIPEYWSVNLKQEVVEVYADPEAAGYRTVRQVARGEILTLPGFPDLKLDIDAIFG